MCGNLAGDGSKEGVSTEKTFSSVIASMFLCFFGVIPLITSRSCKGYCSNNDDTSFEEGRVLSGVDDFELLFGDRDFFEDSLLSFETFYKMKDSKLNVYFLIFNNIRIKLD